MPLILSGTQVPNTARIKDQIVFKPGMPNTRKHPGNWNGVGLHWTGSENPLSTFLRTMQTRELSVQFWQDTDGTLVQLADLNTQCAHIGSPGNRNFVGVETRCRGYATKEDLAEAARQDPTLVARTELDWSVSRDVYHDVIGGKRVGLAAFSPQQIENLIWLCETLAGVCKFPRIIPFEEATPARVASIPLPNKAHYVVTHNGKHYVPAFDRDKKRANTHKGALGHFHVHDVKHDPGTGIFYALWAEGWNPAGKKLIGAR